MEEQLELYTLSVFTENSPGVLQRITVMFTRRKLNIESLAVSETESKGISRFTITVLSDKETISKVAKQIARIVEVLDVTVNVNDQLLFKEIAFYRVEAEAPDRRTAIEELAKRYGASLIHITSKSVVLEKTGSEADINSLYLLLEPFNIQEFVRSGRIAVAKEYTRRTQPKTIE